ncbi:MAG: hypothetical protein GF401_08145 [Chitinivibrionales bacterium]|nr:hypothetical protein [Chitinivibrionales bacterium]
MDEKKTVTTGFAFLVTAANLVPLKYFSLPKYIVSAPTLFESSYPFFFKGEIRLSMIKIRSPEAIIRE